MAVPEARSGTARTVVADGGPLLTLFNQADHWHPAVLLVAANQPESWPADHLAGSCRSLCHAGTTRDQCRRAGLFCAGGHGVDLRLMPRQRHAARDPGARHFDH